MSLDDYVEFRDRVEAVSQGADVMQGYLGYPERQPMRSVMVGCTPAKSASSTRTATCGSWTGSRT